MKTKRKKIKLFSVMDFIFPKMVLRSSEKMMLAIGLFGFVNEKKNDYTVFAAGRCSLQFHLFCFSYAHEI